MSEDAGRFPRRPPRYVNVPVALVYAGGNDPAMLTLIRIVGLCWQHRGRRTPPLSRDALASALGRGPRTLHRHLAYLEEQGWLQVDRQGDRVILCPRCQAGPGPAVEGGGDVGADPPSHALQQALAEAGIENPVRDRLARDPELTPLMVRGWHLWTQHPERAGLENPAGYLVRRLQAVEPPPDDYLQLAGLSEEQWTQLRISRWAGDQDLDEELYTLRPTYLALYPEVAAS